ncbi:MAG: amylo-alpha-1,6-glucosidase [Vulcanococcus sp.]
MTIRFGSEICGDRRLAEQREWLVSNGLGSYGCGTVAGTRTRSYHGLLVAALGAPADPCSRTLLVAALEEHWGMTPIDHRHISAFSLEGTVPCWRFALADSLLEKRIWMQPGAHTTTVHYRLLQTGRPLRLAWRVLVNARSHHGGCERVALRVQPRPHGIAVLPDSPDALLHGAVDSMRRQTSSLETHPMPHRLMQFVVLSDRAEVTTAHSPIWCHGAPLGAEQERGLPSEDLQLQACWITAELSEAQPTLTLVASTQSDPPLDGEANLAVRRAYDDALLSTWQKAHPPSAERAPAWVRQLVLAADAFVVQRGEGQSLLAGYPWFGDWGRDTMISLSGLTLATGRPAIGAQILRTYARHLQAGLLPNRFPEGPEPLGEHDFNTVDATLWFVEALRRQHEATGDTDLIRALLPTLREILEAHCAGTRHGIRRDPSDGLLRAGEEGLQLTWMDAKVNGDVITPRIGKPVEVNALWCCALRTIAEMEELCGDPGAARRVGVLADAARMSFARFWNEPAGCCFDLIEGPDGNPDATIRPNQLLALTLSQALLSPEQARRLLAVVGEHLLTPVGLRSLDPRDGRYQGRCEGGPVARDRAYHQGTVWGWWLGIWALAQARVEGDPGRGLQWLDGIGDQLATAGLGQLSEIFDGDPPHQPRGCIAQAWSVAETLRAWHTLASWP